MYYKIMGVVYAFLASYSVTERNGCDHGTKDRKKERQFIKSQV